MGSSTLKHIEPKHTNCHPTKANMPNVVVCLGGTVKADKSADFKAFAKEQIAKAKGQAACEWVKVMEDKENPHAIAIFQSWTDEAAQQSYAEAMKAEGKIAEVVANMLEAGSYKRRVFAPYSE